MMFKMIELGTLLESFVQALNLADETVDKTVKNLESLLRPHYEFRKDLLL